MSTFPADCYTLIPGLSMIKALDEALTSIAGVLESQLSPDVAAGLPESAPGPPWDCRISSVFWSHKAKPGAAEALPEVLRGSPRVAVSIGALIRYIDSPVGPYREIIAVPAFVGRPFPQAHVAFIAVDSEASVVGGRANWALPKVLARFGGTIGLPGDAAVVGPDWMGARRHEVSAVAIADLAALLLLPVVARFDSTPLPAQGAGLVPLGDGRRRGQLGGRARHLAGVGSLQRLYLRRPPAGGPSKTLTAEQVTRTLLKANRPGMPVDTGG